MICLILRSLPSARRLNERRGVRFAIREHIVYYKMLYTARVAASDWR
jgi:hypothetical protein